LELGEWVATLAQAKMLLQATRNSIVPLIKKHAYFENFATIRNTKAPTVLIDQRVGLATESVRKFWRRNKSKIVKEKRAFKTCRYPQVVLCFAVASFLIITSK
jgi:hypothetical protein